MGNLSSEQIIRLTNILFTAPFALKNIQKTTKNPYFKIGMTFAIIAGGLYTLNEYEKGKLQGNTN